MFKTYFSSSVHKKYLPIFLSFPPMRAIEVYNSGFACISACTYLLVFPFCDKITWVILLCQICRLQHYHSFIRTDRRIEWSYSIFSIVITFKKKND